MKLAFVVIVSTFTLLISFQNCQKPPHPDEINAMSSIGADEKIDLAGQSIDSVDFIVPSTKSITKAGATYQLNYNKVLEINLDTGLIVETSDVDPGSRQFCLPKNLKAELVSVLASSQVCRLQKVAQPEQVCTQVVQQAYAYLNTAQDRYELGYAASVCQGLQIDLCSEDQINTLKGFIANVKANYSSMSCN